MSFSAGLAGQVISAIAGLAKLTSMDTGQTLFFRQLSVSGHKRTVGADWVEVGVAGADPQPSEYRYTRPEVRHYQVCIEDYSAGGEAGSIEDQLSTLKTFTRLAPGKARSHKLMYSHGAQRFGPCVLEAAESAVERTGSTGAALIAREVSLTLRELPR